MGFLKDIGFWKKIKNVNIIYPDIIEMINRVILSEDTPVICYLSNSVIIRILLHI